MKTIISKVKKPLRYFKNQVCEQYHSKKIKKRLAQTQPDKLTGINSFCFEEFRKNVLKFIQSMQLDASKIRYKYSDNCTKSTLYASIYSCMTLSMFGMLDDYSDKEKRQWIDYFDSFQDPKTGLFYDPVVMNHIYPDSDWWGARHLTLHLINGYTDLGMRPKYPFTFLKSYYKSGFIQEWLDGFNWQSASIGLNDIDNKIMNIACMLQFQRDIWNDADASIALKKLKSYLRKVLNPETSMWGRFDLHNPDQRSRMVQFAYHLYLIFFFDEDYDFDIEKIVATVLKTQNRFGGYGVKSNSSACEDIDSIDILLRLYKLCTDDKKAQINRSINLAFDWVLINQVEDGGFVFRLDEPFTYGASETSSLSNRGSMLATWFRVLSIMYMTRHLGIAQEFRITHCPGYEFL